MADAQVRAAKVMARWASAKADLNVLNTSLKGAGLPLLKSEAP